MKSRISLRNFLVIRFGIAGILPVVIVGLFSWQFFIPRMKASTAIGLESMARVVSGQISAHLSGGERQMVSQAKYLMSAHAPVSKGMQSFLDAQCSGKELFESIYITSFSNPVIQDVGLTPSGRFRRFDMLGMDLSNRPFIFPPKGSTIPFWSPTFLSTVSGRLAVALAIPVNQRLLIAEITLNRLSGLISNLPVESGFITLILDRNGRIIGDSTRRHWGEQIHPGVCGMAGSGTAASYAAHTFAFDGRQMLGTVVEIPSCGWRVVVAQPEKEAFLALNAALIVLGLGMGSALILALAGAWIQAGNLTGHIRIYSHYARAIAKGQYEVDIPPAKARELTDLGENLTRMAQLIRKRENALQLTQFSFDKAAIAIYYIESDAGIVNVNARAALNLDYTIEELRQLSLFDIDPNMAEDTWHEHWEDLITGRIRVFESIHRKKNGEIMPVEIHAKVIVYKNRPLLVAFVQDISERHRAQKELENHRNHLETLVEERTADMQKAMEIAEKATKVKSEFLANMSHEIRTPLNAIIGFAHLAMQTGLDEIQFDYVKKIQGSSKALLGVINDILDFSKIEAGRLNMESVDFSLTEVFDNVINLIGITAREKDLEVIFDLAADLPDAFVGDPLRLGQILTNLAGNAVKFTHKGEIVLGCKLIASDKENAELEFYVKDSGIGMSREQQDKLFQSFSQADASTTRKYGGTGLGLFICKSLVKLMNGGIRVESREQEGTTFYFTVSLKQAKSAPVPALSNDPELHHKRILVVDDNDVCRMVLSDMLEKMSFEVAGAQSAKAALEAVQAAKDNPFDLILMDWQMPETDGLAASKQIKESLNVDVPSIIMVSAYAGEDLRQQVGNIGLKGCLTKPVSPSMLLNAVLTALGKKAAADSFGPKFLDELPDTKAVKGAKLLVVEDNEINRQVARGILENNGFVVEMAVNGRLGVEAVQKTAYSAVLMDIHMPEMDGYTAARKIRQDDRFKDLPIIAMTANAMAGDREKAINAGMNDHVAKPIIVRQLIAALCKWIDPETVDPGKGDPPPEKETPKKQAAADFDPLPGINTRDGLERVGGDTVLYNDILEKFSNNQAQAADKIKQAIDDNDLETAKRLAHTAKGVAGNIGAEQIFKTASAVDTALGQNDIKKAEQLLPELDDRIAEAVSGILGLRERLSKKAGAEDRANVSPEAVKQVLFELNELLENDDTHARAVVQQLDKMVPKDCKTALAKLSQQVGDYEFEEAISTLKQIYRMLGIGPV